jgi:hypothetical protein
MQDLYDATEGNPLGNGRVLNWEVLIHAYPVWGAIHVSEIRTLLDLGKGAGTRALNLLTALADHNGVDLTLHPKRVGKRGLTTAQLRQWYKRHGFVSDGRQLRRKKGANNAALRVLARAIAVKKGAHEDQS